MKHGSDDSGIIVYDMHDGYSLGHSSKSKKPADSEEKKETHTSNQKEVNNESLALLGGFSGRVYDKLTYRTIEGALVTIAKDLSIKTDEKGIFIATGIKPGKYRITVFEEGYVAQSCKSAAIAGETTKLDSFHLIPDCLVAEYPNEIAQEEEETVKEELVEFAREIPQSTPSKESTRVQEAKDTAKEETATKEAMSDGLDEQIAQVSSDTVNVEEIHGKSASDLEIRADITTEKTIGHPKQETATKDFSPLTNASGGVLPTIERTHETAADGYIDVVAAAIEQQKEIPPDEIIAVLLEQIQTGAITKNAAEVVSSVPEEESSFIEEPFLAEITLSPVEAVIVEVKQPEETQEKIQKETLSLSEISAEEAPHEIEARHTIQEKVEKVVYQEKPAEPSAGEESEETAPTMEEQPLASSSEVVPETTVEEMVQLREILQAPVGEKSRLGKLWKTLRNKITKEFELSQEPTTGPSAGEESEETAPPPEQMERPLASPVETASEAATQPIAVPLEEIQDSIAIGESIETALFVYEEPVVENVPSVDGLPHISVETVTAEAEQPEGTLQKLTGEGAPIKIATVETIVGELVQEEINGGVPPEDLLSPPMEVIPEISPQEGVTEKVYEEELLEPSVGVILNFTIQEMLLEEVHLEEPSVDVSLQEMPTLAILADSTEAILSEPEETTVGDIFFVDQLPHLFVEIDIPEMKQAEKVLLEIEGEESPIESTAEEIAQEEIKEDVYYEQSLEPSIKVAPEIIVWEEILEEAHKEESLEPLLDVGLGLTVREEIEEVIQPVVALQQTPQEAPQEVSGESSGSKLVWWTRRKKKTKKDDQEPISELSTGISSQIAPQEEILGKTSQEEQSVIIAVNKKNDSIPTETVQTPAVSTTLTDTIESAHVEAAVEDIPSVDGPPRPSIETSIAEVIQPGEVPEVISDEELASMSEEEKEALSRGHDSAEVEGFIGIINAQPNPAYKGLPISIAYTLRNVSCETPDDFIVQIYVVNPDTDTIYDTLEIPVKCNKGTFSMGGFVVFTTSYETYIYRLIMQIVSKKTKTPHLLADISLEIMSIY